jgi:hypothetical protein
MIDTRDKLLTALMQLHPEGPDFFGGADTPTNYPEYVERLLPEFAPAHTEQELDDALIAWDAAAPERERELIAITIPQFRKMLRSQSVSVGGQPVSLKVAVEAAIDAVPNADAKADFLDWYDSPPALIRRTAERIEQIREALGITPEQADQMFLTAKSYQ